MIGFAPYSCWSILGVLVRSPLQSLRAFAEIAHKEPGLITDLASAVRTRIDHEINGTNGVYDVYTDRKDPNARLRDLL